MLDVKLCTPLHTSVAESAGHVTTALQLDPEAVAVIVEPGQPVITGPSLSTTIIL